jgi:hypothetical protein
MSYTKELKNIHPSYKELLVDKKPKTSITLTHALIVLLISSQLTLTHAFITTKPQEPKADIELSIARITTVLSYLVDKSKTQQLIGHEAPPTPQLGIVRAKRLNLRAGPGTNFKPVMTVAEGTTLLIEESMDEEWVSVIAPSGEKAYALKNELSFEATTL